MASAFWVTRLSFLSPGCWRKGPGPGAEPPHGKSRPPRAWKATPSFSSISCVLCQVLLQLLQVSPGPVSRHSGHLSSCCGLAAANASTTGNPAPHGRAANRQGARHACGAPPAGPGPTLPRDTEARGPEGTGMPEWAGCPSPACRPPAQCSPEHPANGPPLRPGSVSTAHPCPSPVTRPSERLSCRPVQCPHLLAPPPQGWPAHPRPAPPALSSRPRQPLPARSVRFGGRELAPHRSRGGALLTGTRSLNFDCGWPSHGPGRGPARGPPTLQTSTWGSVGLRIPPLFGGSDVRTWISGPTQSWGPLWSQVALSGATGSQERESLFSKHTSFLHSRLWWPQPPTPPTSYLPKRPSPGDPGRLAGRAPCPI